jgi:putative oxidoreductase
MNSAVAKFEKFEPQILSILRIIVALLFLEHGLSKLFGFPQPMPAPPMFSLIWCAGVIEVAGSLFLLIGLFTRLAAFIMSGEMAFAYFMVHAPKAFYPLLNAGDAAVLFCFIFLFFVFAGGGPWSLDAKMGNK